MADIRIDWKETIGVIKPMHAVNNGVAQGRMNNFEDYRKAGFPYMRNHDASYCEEYGSEHCVDISAVFPDFDADPEDPASYEFTETDAYLGRNIEAGTKIFYRLGQGIEHTVKKYNVNPPKDFQKWSVICEHIIRHYNEGWADGHHWNLTYWEIWNSYPEYVNEFNENFDREMANPDSDLRKEHDAWWAELKPKLVEEFGEEWVAEHCKD